MTDKVDISPEAVEVRAACHDQFVGCDYDLTMTQDGHAKTAATLRALSARVAELEADLPQPSADVINTTISHWKSRAEAAEQRAAELEAKLAKAVAYIDSIGRNPFLQISVRQYARTTLAEIQTETKEQTPTTHRQRGGNTGGV